MSIASLFSFFLMMTEKEFDFDSYKYNPRISYIVSPIR